LTYVIEKCFGLPEFPVPIAIGIRTYIPIFVNQYKRSVVVSITRFLKMRNLTYLLFMVIILLSVLQACNERRPKNYNNADADAISFIHNGIKTGLAEIKASGLAITNSSNQRVIGLAIMIIDDQTKATEQLKLVAVNKKINEKDTIDVNRQQAINDLSKKSATVFDKAYIQMMVDDHEQSVKLFTSAAQNDDIEVKNFATRALTTMQMHLDSANAILSALK
jgi:putative membrane protein